MRERSKRKDILLCVLEFYVWFQTDQEKIQALEAALEQKDVLLAQALERHEYYNDIITKLPM
ncbi:MAG: hypothetical protein U5L45_19380 [Saprospiraceae bacterium]|nr:hypothetical protein [Saprospiraceae bacterium]MDZ7879848.1 hypothetical protein [Saprospiraceae bacterium]